VSVFADTSALVKLYVPEAGHGTVRAIAEPLVIAGLTRVELPAALWRKHRQGQLSAGAATVLASAFEVDFYGTDEVEPRFAKIRLDDAILSAAGRLVTRLPLRAGDAIQLASAVAARSAGRDVTSFAAFDAHLRTAAAIEGFALVPADSVQS
jgi:predicted nucleic acid-binding protein